MSRAEAGAERMNSGARRATENKTAASGRRRVPHPLRALKTPRLEHTRASSVTDEGPSEDDAWPGETATLGHGNAHTTGVTVKIDDLEMGARRRDDAAGAPVSDTSVRDLEPVSPRSRSRFRRCQTAGLIGADGACLLIALYVARPEPSTLTLLAHDKLAVALAVATWVLTLQVMGLHPNARLPVGEESRRILAATGMAVPVLFLSGWWPAQPEPLRQFAVAWVALVGLTTVSRRAKTFHPQTSARRGDGALSTAIVGDKDHALAVAQTLRATRRFYPIGYIGPAAGSGEPDGLPQIGELSSLCDTIREHGLRCVFVGAGTPRDDLIPIMREAREHGVEIRTVTGLPVILPSRLRLEDVAGLATVAFKPPKLSGPQAALKRLFDLLVAFMGLVVLSPLLVAVSVAIRLASPGPAIYRQLRVTLRGRTFTMYKFRTMMSDASLTDTVIDLTQPYFKMRDDPRICPLGKLLRRLSIDELPQLMNVLRGEMSLVGPRPLWVRQVGKDLERLEARHDVRAGITGWWQINGRSDVPPDEALRMDVAYVENWSFGLDLYILLRTVGAVLSGRGAY